MAIDLTIEDGVAIITINRPERKNAILLAMRLDIERAFQTCQDDPEVRVVIFTGAGSDFAAGADIAEMGSGGVQGSLLKMRHMHRMSRAIANTNKPVISAVEGVCIGMAWSMVLSTDIIVAAENARFQFAFRHIGLAPDGGAAYLLSRHVPIQRAKEIIYSGRFVSGAEAHQLGLALHMTAPGGALERARELALSFTNAPTIAIGMAKRMFEAAPAQNLDQALDFEANIQPLMVQTEDFKEGTTSFKEKRKAVFVAN